MAIQNRRRVLKTAGLIAGAAGLEGGLSSSIHRALAIEPEPGSSFLDAEHVVILMQENRSFDHAFGTLQGVRGFNDPRAITLPDGNPVWVQTDDAGRSFVPFRLNIKDSRATWMGCLPHGWTDQTDARNLGRCDRWLQAKRSGVREYAAIDTSLEYVELEQDLARKSANEARGSSIGLGYRVPLVIASPWSRGGCVCSQVFDHTSTLQFLETLFSHKFGKPVEEPNISRWRRTVCGDLTAVFQGESDMKVNELPFPSRYAFMEQIHRSQFKQLPTGYQELTHQEIEQMRQDRFAFPQMPQQETGVRRSSPLPYELAVDGILNNERTHFAIELAARNGLFGKNAAGSPFVAYAFLGKSEVQVVD